MCIIFKKIFLSPQKMEEQVCFIKYGAVEPFGDCVMFEKFGFWSRPIFFKTTFLMFLDALWVFYGVFLYFLSEMSAFCQATFETGVLILHASSPIVTDWSYHVSQISLLLKSQKSFHYFFPTAFSSFLILNF